MRRFLPVLAFLVLCAPLPLLAASAGDLVKAAAHPAVYYFGADGKRYVFPNSASYFSWYDDFASVKTVSDAELAAMPIGGNVTYRPGTRMVKIQTDPKVYAVGRGGVLRHVGSEAVAQCLFGGNWNAQIDDIPDAFFVDYEIGEPVAHCVAYDPGAERLAVPTIGVDKGLEGPPADPFPTVPTWSVVLGAPSPSAGGEGTLMELRFRTPLDLTVTRLPVQLDALYGAPVDGVVDADLGGLVRGAGVRPNLKSLRWVDASGNLVFSEVALSLATADDQRQTLEFGGAWRVPAGTDARIRLVAAFDEELPSGEAYRAAVPVARIVLADDAGNARPFLPSFDLVGPNVAVQGDAFAVSVAPIPTPRDHVRGARGVDVAAFTFRAPGTTSATVRSIAFQGYIDEQESAGGFLPGADADNGTETRVRDHLSALWLTDEAGTVVAGPAAVELGGRAVFSGMALALPAGSVRTYRLRGDLSPDAPVEEHDDLLAFDVVDAASDIEAYDASGARLSSSGLAPNGGANPVGYVAVRKHGTLTMAWQGAIASAVAGRETLIGTLEISALRDSFMFSTITFASVGQSRESLLGLRLAYTAPDGSAASAAADFAGNDASFTGLALRVPKDGVVRVPVYARLGGIGQDRLSGERLRVIVAPDRAMAFASEAEGRSFTHADLSAAGPLRLPTGAASDLTMRLTELVAARHASTPSGTVARGQAVEVLRFTLTAAPEGAARVRKLAFRIEPGDVNRDGADSDVLERWADVNGDAADDNDLLELRRLRADGGYDVIGEGFEASVRYGIVRDGAADMTPQGVDTRYGDQGLIEMAFAEGSEHLIAAGETATFVLALKTDSFTIGTWTLKSRLLGGADFLWTDAPSGYHAPWDGAETLGLPVVSPELTVS